MLVHSTLRFQALALFRVGEERITKEHAVGAFPAVQRAVQPGLFRMRELSARLSLLVRLARDQLAGWLAFRQRAAERCAALLALYVIFRGPT